MKRLTESFVDGFNACLLVVGEASSARDQLYAGAASGRKGLVPLIFRDVYQEVAQSADNGQSTVSASFWELHDERVTDLLRPSNKPLKVVEDPTRGHHIPGITCAEVRRFVSEQHSCETHTVASAS